MYYIIYEIVENIGISYTEHKIFDINIAIYWADIMALTITMLIVLATLITIGSLILLLPKYIHHQSHKWAKGKAK